MQYSWAMISPQKKMSKRSRNLILETILSRFIKQLISSPSLAAAIQAFTGLIIVILAITSGLDGQNELSENSDYKEQLEQLNQVESNINELLAFVENQKVELKDAEDTIAALESEQQALEPIVKTNREVVDALFQVQEERTKANVWQERGIGFGLGIVASVIASLLLAAGQTVLRSRSRSSDEDESSPAQ